MKNGVNGDIQSENGKEIRQRSRLKAYTNSKSMLLIDSGAYFTFSIGPLRRSEFFLPILTRAQDKCSGDDPPRVPRRSSCGKKTSLFGPLGGVGGRSGPAVPQGAAPGNEGGGRREGGVPRGGAQRWEEPPPPPRPPAPLRSAPRPPTVPVPVAVPPAPAAPCPERAGPAAPWPGRSGIGSSARSWSGTSATSECRTSKVNKRPRDPSHAAPLLFLLVSVLLPVFPRARGSAAHPTAAGKEKGAGGFPRRGCGARRGEGEQPGEARRGAAEPGPTAPEGPSRNGLRAPAALAAEQAVPGSPCLAANGSFGFHGWEESRGQSGEAAGAARTLLALGPRSRRGRRRLSRRTVE